MSTLFLSPVNKSFIRSTFSKAIMPLTSNSMAPSLSKRSTKVLMGVMSLLWVAALLAAVKSGPSLAHAAPTKKKYAQLNVINAMSFKVSEKAALPLQLQIEATVKGQQKLAYMPQTGPALDFYYLNYRPSYLAGESKIDFWLYSSVGSKVPKTASLDLYDEYGRVKLMTIVPPGTPIPKNAAKGEPFIWKSWAIPTSIKSKFDFSDRFRVVLTTSDDLEAAAKARAAANAAPAAAKPVVQNVAQKPGNGNEHTGDQKKNLKQKRYFSESIVFPMYDFLAKAKSKIAGQALAATAPAPADPAVPVVQDRILRIKGLKATPGGQPNPAKANIATSAPVPPPPSPPKAVAPSSTVNNNDVDDGNDGQDRIKSGGDTLVNTHSGAQSTVLAIALAYVVLMLL
ncbi:hypothetical protein BGZ73_004316 [Actinomortierella ambigua]|nr:hypothetical protein BGZ73_004316 [Actinomortierella ambigua]